MRLSSLRRSPGADRALMLALGTAARVAGRYRPVVLRYHSLDPSGSRQSVPRDHFAAQMAYLKQAGFTVVPLAQAIAVGAAGRLAAITFDDGYCNTLTEAAPALEALGFPMTVYIAPGLLGGLPPWATAGQDWLEIMPAEELCGLAAKPGVTVGAHTLTHPRLDRLDPASARREIAGSKQELSGLLGREVNTFCYPHGAYTRETIRIVRECGYTSACTVEPGTALRLKSPLEVCRIYVSPAMDILEFAAALTCASDWRLAIRRAFKRVVASEAQTVAPGP